MEKRTRPGSSRRIERRDRRSCTSTSHTLIWKRASKGDARDELGELQ